MAHHCRLHTYIQPHQTTSSFGWHILPIPRSHTDLGAPRELLCGARQEGGLVGSIDTHTACASLHQIDPTSQNSADSHTNQSNNHLPTPTTETQGPAAGHLHARGAGRAVLPDGALGRRYLNICVCVHLSVPCVILGFLLVSTILIPRSRRSNRQDHAPRGAGGARADG